MRGAAVQSSAALPPTLRVRAFPIKMSGTSSKAQGTSVWVIVKVKVTAEELKGNLCCRERSVLSPPNKKLTGFSFKDRVTRLTENHDKPIKHKPKKPSSTES